jgi:hypothetical protein
LCRNPQRREKDMKPIKYDISDRVTYRFQFLKSLWSISSFLKVILRCFDYFVNNLTVHLALLMSSLSACTLERRWSLGSSRILTMTLFDMADLTGHRGDLSSLDTLNDLMRLP